MNSDGSSGPSIYTTDQDRGLMADGAVRFGLLEASPRDLVKLIHQRRDTWKPMLNDVMTNDSRLITRASHVRNATSAPPSNQQLSNDTNFTTSPAPTTNTSSTFEFSNPTFNIIRRIEANPNVYGVVYYRNDRTQLCTVPEDMVAPLTVNLPDLNTAVHRAVLEIDVRDELVAYRIETVRLEISVVKDKEFAACVVHKTKRHNSRKIKKERNSVSSNLVKDAIDEKLLMTTISLNAINPIVDRIMEDESVEGVVMTNKEGLPILTNINVMGATNYGIAMRKLGTMAQAGVKEVDPFDEVVVLRLCTLKFEIMVAHHSEFNIIVLQHSRASKLKQ